MRVWARGLAIGRAVEETLGNRRGQRTDLKPDGQGELLEPELVQNFAHVESGQKTREIAAEKAGFGNAKTYQQAKAVVDQGAPEVRENLPEVAGSVSAHVRREGNVQNTAIPQANIPPIISVTP